MQLGMAHQDTPGIHGVVDRYKAGVAPRGANEVARSGRVVIDLVRNKGGHRLMISCKISDVVPMGIGWRKFGVAQSRRLHHPTDESR